MSGEFSKQNYPVMVKTIFHLHTLHKQRPHVCVVCVAVVVHQESVCATLGSGLSSACVVDVGDQKTSVCCVEDGVSHRSSRLHTHTLICR